MYALPKPVLLSAEQRRVLVDVITHHLDGQEWARRFMGGETEAELAHDDLASTADVIDDDVALLEQIRRKL
jgi:hypothetical protein